MNRSSFFTKLMQGAATIPFVGAIVTRSAQPPMIYGTAVLGESLESEPAGPPPFNSFGPEAASVTVFLRSSITSWRGPLDVRTLRNFELDPEVIQVAVRDAQGFIRETFDVTQGYYR